MVATAHHLATAAGVWALEQGGNAFDAAVAAAFALGVCEPAASGLGGQTMALLYEARSGVTRALDGSSRAPNLTNAVRLTRAERSRGYRAATVPSTPAALNYIRRRYGRLRLKRLLEPAIRLAELGYPVSRLQRALAERELKALRASTAARLFLDEGRRPYPAGALFRQPALAETLRRLAAAGVKDFYRGRIAREIDADMRAHDGLIRREDLAQIPLPIERRPVAGRWGGMRLLSFPEPAAGRALAQMAHLYEHLPARLQELDSAAGAVALVEIIRRAHADRAERPYDPDYFPQVRSRRASSPKYAARIIARIRALLERRGETTHLSVMDREGNAIALTQSIERIYGARVATPSLGFLYNNYMGAFETRDIGHPYYLRPNAVPWASVAPTILLRGRRPFLAIGSPGSERIAATILQVLARLRRSAPLEAVSAPRLHCSAGGRVSVEKSPSNLAARAALAAHGFELDERERWSFYLGCVQLVLREGGQFVGVADPRRDGSAGGPGPSAEQTPP